MADQDRLDTVCELRAICPECSTPVPKAGYLCDDCANADDDWDDWDDDDDWCQCGMARCEAGWDMCRACMIAEDTCGY